MPIVYGLLGLVALVLLLVLLVLFVPVFVRFSYEEDLSLTVRVLGVPIRLLPREPCPEKEKKEKKNRTEPAEKKQKKPSVVRQVSDEIRQSFQQDGTAATLSLLREGARLTGTALADVLKGITVSRLRLWIFLGEEDAGDTAVSYGQACSVVFPALTVLERFVRIRRRDVRVEPNFLAERSTASFDIHTRIFLFRVLWAILWLYIRVSVLKPKEE